LKVSLKHNVCGARLSCPGQKMQAAFLVIDID